MWFTDGAGLCGAANESTFHRSFFSLEALKKLLVRRGSPFWTLGKGHGNLFSEGKELKSCKYL
jgi:hypothetical protein